MTISVCAATVTLSKTFCQDQVMEKCVCVCSCMCVDLKNMKQMWYLSVFLCVRVGDRGEFAVPDSHQAAYRGWWRGAAGVLCSPVERGRGVAVQGAAWHILQQFLLHRSPHRYKELQGGEMFTQSTLPPARLFWQHKQKMLHVMCSYWLILIDST